MSIPAHAVTEGNLDLHSVCQPCAAAIKNGFEAPCIALDSLSGAARTAIGLDRYAPLFAARLELRHLVFDILLPDCPTKGFLLSLFPARAIDFVREPVVVVSMFDLHAMKAGHFAPWLLPLLTLYANHVHVCDYCGQKEQLYREHHHLLHPGASSDLSTSRL